MKNFKRFFEEISIEGHPSIPGEGGMKPEDKKRYLSEVERRADRRLGLGPDKSWPGNIGLVMRQLIRTDHEIISRFTEGRYKELSELATNVIYSTFKDIIDRYEIELDIEVCPQRNVKSIINNNDEEDEEDIREFEKILEEDIKNEIFKRKISNLITQGEAKNCEDIFNSKVCIDGLKRIYGRDYDTVRRLMDEVILLRNKMDWSIPSENRGPNDPIREKERSLGLTSIDWKPKEKKDEDKNEDEDDEDFYKKFISGEDDQDYQQDEEMGSTPILRARGIDFTLTIWESVKGMFEILSLGGIPSDKKVAKDVLFNTESEQEDFKWGTEIAIDLKNFVNKNPKVKKYPNVREELFKMMIDKETMPTKEFLDLFRGILNETDAARKKIDSLIDKVIENIESQKKYEEDMRKYEEDMRKYQEEMDKYEEEMNRYEEEIDRYEKEEGDLAEIGREDEDEIQKIIKKQEDIRKDYSTLSKRELMAEIDAALDSGDYKRVEMLSAFIKENKKYKKY